MDKERKSRDPNEGEYAKLIERYSTAGHRIQTAISFLISGGLTNRVDPKHMRTGIDLSKSDMGGLAWLLIEKGVFTKLEYIQALTQSAEREADKYENALPVNFGINLKTL